MIDSGFTPLLGYIGLTGSLAVMDQTSFLTNVDTVFFFNEADKEVAASIAKIADTAVHAHFKVAKAEIENASPIASLAGQYKKLYAQWSVDFEIVLAPKQSVK